MKKRILVYAFVLIAALTLVGCKNDPGAVLVDIAFNAPGYGSNSGKRALTDHDYTAADYSVIAVYSNGSKKDVTKDAKITSPFDSGKVKIGSGNTLRFSDPNAEGITDFPLTIQYGGKTIRTTVNAYGAGNAIGGLENVKTGFMVGEKVDKRFAGITYLDKNGVPHTSQYLPKDSTLFVVKKDDVVEKVTLSDGYTIEGDELGFVYVTYLEGYDEETRTATYSSMPEVINDIEIVENTDIESISRVVSSEPIGGTYSVGITEAEAVKNIVVNLKDKYGNSHIVQATDKDGNAKLNFSVLFNGAYDKNGNSKEPGTVFVRGDYIKLKVLYYNYNGSSGMPLEYTKIRNM